MGMRTVVFDLDGTLADTSADLLRAANGCFADLGLGEPLNLDRDQATAFRGGRAMLALGFERTLGSWDKGMVDAQFPQLLGRYKRGIDVHTKLYPGALEALGRLAASGYALAVCTNKPESLANLLLERLGVRDLFASLVGADTLPVRKPDPQAYFASVDWAGGEREASLLVGDTETDFKTARNAGVPFVLVDFGQGAPGRAWEPDLTLHDFGSIDGAVKGLIG